MGRGAFNSYKLTSINVENMNLQYSSYDGVLLNKDRTDLLWCPGGKSGFFSIPDGVIHLADSAFGGCGFLTNITVPVGVTSIGEDEFRGCDSLTSVTLPNGLTNINDYAFYKCKSLRFINLPSSLASIGDRAFSYCTSLENITLPLNISTIKNKAFRGCSKLSSVTFLGDAPTFMGMQLFSQTDSDFTIHYLNWKTGFTTPSWRGSPTYPIYFDYKINNDSVTIIDFDNTVKGTVSIPATIDGKPVTNIGVGAFRSCALSGIIFPDSLVSISTRAFDYCTSLTSITIPSGVTYIDSYAFEDCNKLDKVIFLGNAPTTFGSGVFTGSAINFKIYYQVNSTGFMSPKWKGYPASPWVFSHKIIGDSVTITDCNTATTGIIMIPETIEGRPVTTIGEKAFFNCELLTSIMLPQSITNIGEGAFWFCKGLESIVMAKEDLYYTSVNGVLFNRDKTVLIAYPGNRSGYYQVPDGVIEIADWAFADCGDSLEGVILSESVSSVSEGAFYGCTSLMKIPLGSNVTNIGPWAFQLCSSATNAIIPNSIESIGNSAFLSCGKLVSATFQGDAPETFGTNVFDGTDPDFSVYYLSKNSGFTSPEWMGYSASKINETNYPAASWLLIHGFAYNTNLELDVNGDKVTLLMAYALNLNPNTNLSNHLPKAKITAGTMDMSFYAASLGITYTVETSTDLQTWTTTNVSLSNLNSENRRTATVNLTIAPYRFLRLKVEKQD